MELTAEEFVRRVRARGGERVSGAFVSGPVRLDGGVVFDTDWSGCSFDSSVELDGCTLQGTLPAGAIARDGVMPLRCLDLSDSQIAGGVRIRGPVLASGIDEPVASARGGFRAGGLATESAVALEMRFEAASIGGDLEVDRWSPQMARGLPVAGARIDASRCRVDGQVAVTSTHEAGMSLLLARALVGRGLAARGRFACVDTSHADLGGSMLIELSPRRPERRGDETVIPHTGIDLRQSRVRGDFTLTSHHGTSEPYNQADDEGIDLLAYGDLEGAPMPEGRIVAEVMASRATVERDVLIGREASDHLSDDCVVELGKVDLSRIRVGGDLSVARARLAGFATAEEDTHAFFALRLRDAQAESVHIHLVDIDLDVAMHLPAGDRLTIFDLGGLRVQRGIELVGLRGQAARELPLNALGASLRQAECATLILHGVDLQVTNGDTGEELLGIDATGISVADEAHLGKPDGDRGDPFVDLSESDLGCLTLAEPLPEGRVHLTGARVGRWGMAPRDGLGDQESFEAYKRLLACADSLDVAQYVAVERRLAEIGKTHDADRMHVHWKRLERSRLRGYRKLASHLHHWFLGYGTQVWRPALMLAAVFLLSTVALTTYHPVWLQISDSKQAELTDCGYRCIDRLSRYQLPTDWKGRMTDAAAVTAKGLVPIVDLELATHLEAIPGTAGSAWVSLLRTLGYLLWPVFLTGLVAQLLPQGRNAR